MSFRYREKDNCTFCYCETSLRMATGSLYRKLETLLTAFAVVKENLNVIEIHNLQ